MFFQIFLTKKQQIKHIMLSDKDSQTLITIIRSVSTGPTKEHAFMRKLFRLSKSGSLM